MNEAIRWRRVAFGALVGLVLLLGCSGDESAGGADAPFDIELAQLEPPLAIPLQGELPFLIPGSQEARWIESGSQICVHTPLDPTATTACTEFASLAREISFAWSADASKLYFANVFGQRLPEPSIWQFDIETATLENLIADQATGTGDDDAMIEQAPFTSDQGEVYFFRWEGDRYADSSLWTIDDGTPRSLDMRFEQTQVSGSVHRVGADQFVFRTAKVNEIQGGLLFLDLHAGTTRRIATPGIFSPVIVASTTGLAVVGDSIMEIDRTSPYLLLDLSEANFGATQPILPAPEAGRRPGFPSFAIAPDGSALVLSYRTVADEPEALLGYVIGTDGVLGQSFEIAPPGFLGVDDSGQDRGHGGSNTRQRMIWTDDNQLLILTGDQALVFQMTSGT